MELTFLLGTMLIIQGGMRLKNKIIIISSILCILISFVHSPNAFAQEAPFEVESPSALLMDFDSKTILYEKNPHEKLPIASITKIMTILLTMEGIEEGRIKLEEEVTVSEYASSMGGSQVFLDSGEKLPVSAILKAIIVASANDASVAIAEKISGTEETFVKKMNEKAKILGMKNTSFLDCTGLSDENNYSTAYDVSIMSRELLKYPLFFKWSTIWLDNLKESKNNTELTNTNRLVRFYDGCDGVKTGSTSKAKSCLSASAKRGNLRLISVVLAAPTSQVRFSEASKLLDFGFANYEALPLLRKGDQFKDKITVTGGKEEEITGFISDDFSMLQKKGEESDYSLINKIDEPIKAPIKKGEKIGSIVIQSRGKDIGSVSILADQDIKKANIYDYFLKILKDW